jgi:hypothetical protein
MINYLYINLNVVFRFSRYLSFYPQTPPTPPQAKENGRLIKKHKRIQNPHWTTQQDYPPQQHALCNAARTAQKANGNNGGHQQGQHGRHDGTDECISINRRWQENQQQGKHTSGKKTTPAGNGAGGNETKKPKRKSKLCPNCKTFVYHTPNKCYELEANKGTHYPRWMSVFAAK